MRSESPIRYSIVVPFFNEQENVPPLYMKLTEVMDSIGEPYELVFVDDGSRDNTFKVLSEIYEHDRRVNLVRLRRNFGQTAGLKAGFDFARGEIIISMDGDLQHDPEEIPRFLEKIEEGYDLVSGWRHERKDHWLMRQLPSRAANWMMAKLSGIDLHDFGTTFKAYRREIIQEIQLYGELHRFIPALASSTGAKIAEVPISNLDRKSGKFTVQRKTIGKRMAAKLKKISAELDKLRHDPIQQTGDWLKRVVQGYFNYHVVPGNLRRLFTFRGEIARRWLFHCGGAVSATGGRGSVSGNSFTDICLHPKSYILIL